MFLILFENQIQTTSALPCRTQVQPAASFLVCSLIFIEYKIVFTDSLFQTFISYFKQIYKWFKNFIVCQVFFLTPARNLI